MPAKVGRGRALAKKKKKKKKKRIHTTRRRREKSIDGEISTINYHYYIKIIF